MGLVVTVTETPTYVTINETNTEVTLNQSDNPIQVTTSTDLISALGLAVDVTYTNINDTLPGGNVQDALSDLADQFYRQAATPSGSNLAEGDLWYNTSSEELFVYRQVSGGYEWHTIASAGGSSPTSFTLDGGSFQDNNMAVNIIKIKRTTGTTAPSSLSAGELAYSGGAGTQGNNGQRLFIGDPANSNAVTVIGGNYFSNLLDHAHGTTTASSALIVNAAKSTSELRTPALYLGTSGNDTLVTSTAAELNALDGITTNVTELNYLDGTSLGTVVANKVLAVNSYKDITGFRNVTLTGELDAGSLDVSGNIDVDGVTNLDNTDIDGSLTVDGAVDINATTFDIDASDDVTIDTSDTTGGIKIGANVSGVPVVVGHTTSEVTVGDNLTVTGNLTVSGTTTTVNSSTVAIADPIFELGVSGSDDNLDRGIKMKYNSGGAKFAFMGYDDSDGKFTMIPNATDTNNVFSGTIGTLKANIDTGNTGIKVGGSVPFSDNGSGVLTLQNIDALDATTENTLEAAIDSLSNLTTTGTITSGTWNGTTIATANGGTGLTSHGSSGQIMVSTGSGFVMQSIDGGTYS